MFEKENLKDSESLESGKRFLLFGENLYLVPEQMPDLKGLRVLRPGLHLGTAKKDRFEPSHALALFLKREECETGSGGRDRGSRTAVSPRGDAAGGRF